MLFKRWLRGDKADEDAVAGYSVPQREAPGFKMVDPGSRQRPAFLDSVLQGEGPEARNAMLPRFSASASDDVQTSGEDPKLARARLALRDALGASQPVTSSDRFAGRHDALAQLIAAVEQQRVHVVIYGERGIGKTSLVHVFADTAREARYLVIYGTCGAQAKFDDMFRAFAARIPMLYHASVLPTAAETEHGRHFDSLLPDGPAGPREFSDLLSDVVGTRIILILDEYDRVVDPSFRRDVAELIKNLSDRAARVQLVLTGVASNLDELIGYAPSIRRNIIGLPMRPLTLSEVRALLGLGETAAGLHFSDEATSLIATMANGSPYLVRLLGHRAGLAALDQRVTQVSVAHARLAVERVLGDWNASLPRRTQTALNSDAARAEWPLLVAAAQAGTYSDGWFGVEEVHAALGGQALQPAIERTLRSFAGPNGLVELVEDGGDPRFRYRYPGVASLLLMSASMAGIAD
ncbi:MAG: AAA family ATPase [Polymorphobacter sp.]